MLVVCLLLGNTKPFYTHKWVVKKDMSTLDLVICPSVILYPLNIYCGLLQAWFRELPEGILDALSPEQVLECHTEEESVALVKLLPSTQAALLDWAINLMADVVEEEAFNKMNARNVAMVFAPNMTQVIHSSYLLCVWALCDYSS